MPDTFPAVVVEAAWAYTPNQASPVWVELPGWRSIDISRGRQAELGTFSPGTLTVVCSDRDRQLDPTNVAATHAGNLLPMRRIRVVATFDAVVYPLFYGYIDSFDHAYAGPPHGDVTATITATDGFKVLEAAILPSSVYAQEVAVDSPSHWWRLGEAAGTTLAFDAIGTAHAVVYGAPIFGTDGMVVHEADTAVRFDAVGQGLVVPAGTFPTGTGPFTIEVIARFPAHSVTRVVWESQYSASTLSLTMDAALTDLDGSVMGTAVSTNGANFEDDAPHHVAIVRDGTNRLYIYVDGVDRTNGTPSSAASIVDAPITIGNVQTFGNTPNHTIDELAVYPTALSAARIAAHAAARATAWDNDTPGGRAARILDAVGWPAALRDLDTGTSTLQSADLDATALDHLQKIADSDFGALFMAADGDVTFVGRDSLWNRPSEGIFGDDPADVTELGYRSIRPEYTDALIRNDVTVSRSEGIAQRVEDATSIGQFTRHSYTVDGLLHDDDLLSRHAAEFLVAEFKDPRRRISEMTIAPQGATGVAGATPTLLFPQVLGRELLDSVTVIDRPAGGTANEQDSSIEGIAHSILPKWWETRWNLTPEFGSGGVGDDILELDRTAGPGLDFERLAF